jgi:hypothetical protein
VPIYELRTPEPPSAKISLEMQTITMYDYESDDTDGYLSEKDNKNFGSHLFRGHLASSSKNRKTRNNSMDKFKNLTPISNN